jgi:hypothetical protein
MLIKSETPSPERPGLLLDSGCSRIGDHFVHLLEFGYFRIVAGFWMLQDLLQTWTLILRDCFAGSTT